MDGWTLFLSILVTQVEIRSHFITNECRKPGNSNGFTDIFRAITERMIEWELWIWCFTGEIGFQNCDKSQNPNHYQKQLFVQTSLLLPSGPNMKRPSCFVFVFVTLFGFRNIRLHVCNSLWFVVFGMRLTAARWGVRRAWRSIQKTEDYTILLRL